MNICICGSQGTYHCTSCMPCAILCINCISVHLSQNSEDTVRPILPKPSNPNPSTCESCHSEKAVKLGIFSDYTKRLCRICKSSVELCIDLKWSNFVSKYSDLELLTQRKSALKRLLTELDESRGLNSISTTLESIKNSIQRALDLSFSTKQTELLNNCSVTEEAVGRIRKEACEQVLKKNLDLGTDGGRLLNTFVHKGRCDLTVFAPKIIFPDPKPLEAAILQFVKGIKMVEKEKNDKFVYLFTPGKSILVRVNLKELRKSEVIFEKNWNFEASWCLLDNGDIFLCGGNGRDSSEVLRVSTEPANIRSLKGFGGRSGHSVLQIDREVYVFGGNKGTFTEKYLLDEDKWVILTTLPQKLQRSSSCLVNEGAITTGSESDKLFLYQINENSFIHLNFPLSGYSLRNKIIFFNEKILFCLTGDKFLIYDWEKKAMVKDLTINDRDWWSYSTPIIHNGCAYFIKYFVRNLWRVSLENFKLTEIPLNTLN